MNGFSILMFLLGVFLLSGPLFFSNCYHDAVKQYALAEKDFPHIKNLSFGKRIKQKRKQSRRERYDAKSSGNGIPSHDIKIRENAYSIDQSEKDWSML